MGTNKVNLTAIVVIAGLLFSLAVSAQKENTGGVKKIQALPRDLEIQLALSALPPHLRDSATVYVLNPDKGFEVARKSTDKFYAFVARTGDDAMRGSWPLKEYPVNVLYPIAFDHAGFKAQMRVFFDIAQMQAKGVPAEVCKKTIQDRYKKNYYKAPERAGISYMLSPILSTYTNPEENDDVQTYCIPHVMYYAPNVSNKDVGGGMPAGTYPFVILSGPHGYNIQLLGQTERAAIKKDYGELLARLCQINSAWCSPKDPPSTFEHHH